MTAEKRNQRRDAETQRLGGDTAAAKEAQQ